MKYIVFICSLFLLFSCQKEEFEIHNLNGNQISVIGHGGMGIGHTYPMNSLESILNSLNLGAEGIEMDIQMTKDGVLVAYHDSTLQESTNLSGLIHHKTWEELKNARYSYPHYANYKLVRLEDVLKSISNPSQYIYFFDIKGFYPQQDSLFRDQLIQALIEIIDKYNLVEKTFVEFKNEVLISHLYTLRPDIKQFVYNEFDYALKLAIQYGLHGITIPVDKLTQDKVKLAHSHHVMVATFNTHSSKRNIRAVKHNVDYIHTDRLKHLLKILNK